MGAVCTLTHIKITAATAVAAAAQSAVERRVCVQYGSAFAITSNSFWNYLKINLISNTVHCTTISNGCVLLIKERSEVF